MSASPLLDNPAGAGRARCDVIGCTEPAVLAGRTEHGGTCACREHIPLKWFEKRAPRPAPSIHSRNKIALRSPIL